VFLFFSIYQYKIWICMFALERAVLRPRNTESSCMFCLAFSRGDPVEIRNGKESKVLPLYEPSRFVRRIQKKKICKNDSMITLSSMLSCFSRDTRRRSLNRASPCVGVVWPDSGDSIASANNKQATSFTKTGRSCRQLNKYGTRITFQKE
jgi:hypothetical protein